MFLAKFGSFILGLTLLFSLLLFVPPFVHAESFGCVITKVGSPVGAPPALPPECLTANLQGVQLPPNIDRLLCKRVDGNPKGAWDPDEGTSTIAGIAGSYCRMPESLNGSYTLAYRREWDTYGPQVWGSEEILAVLYTVAQRWQATYCTQAQITEKTCKARLFIRDITSPYHFSHKWGSAADLHATTNGTDCVANFGGSYGCSKSKYNAGATITLGKLLLDTKYMRRILHNGDTIPINGSTVNGEINKYAKQTQSERFPSHGDAVEHVDGHDDHFHIYMDRNLSTILSNDRDEAKLKLCKDVPGVGCGL